MTRPARATRHPLAPIAPRTAAANGTPRPRAAGHGTTHGTTDTQHHAPQHHQHAPQHQHAPRTWKD
ncbi:hypothetical protein ACFPPE_14430 [Agromyces tardus]|uniref:hypothetical protein n=1 Tax=Agromyces tardus TaxID=2583849 RepID=UPI00110C6C4C|nr:hypothetical protein [Agromyces tardus]